jgi:actin-related protein
MQKQSWSLNGQDHLSVHDDNDDDNDVQLGNNTFYKRNAKEEEEEEEEEEQETLKTENTQKTARQTMIERKLHDADARGLVFT